MCVWRITVVASLVGLGFINEAVGQSPTANQEGPELQTSVVQTNILQSDANKVVWFESKIRPLLIRRCYECHSSASGKTHGGLALDTKPGWEQGGDSGAAIVPGELTSLLLAAVEYAADGPQMPPEEAGGKLPDSEIELLKQWVRDGAVDPRTEHALRGGLTEAELRGWWSFQPLDSPTLERLLASQQDIAPGIESTLDYLIRQRLSEVEVLPAEEADRRTLIRRATYDLTGLPPTPDEVDTFVSDADPHAYSRMIDRLLESPRYGERWGRHWLDVVRYADTAGENTDHPIPDAWRFRNWVIDAFNQDMPYDRFIREQIAGDLLHADDPPAQFASGIIATGFLAIARRFDHDSDKHMHLTYEDTIDTLGRAVLGLSIACARCHDHKYDPISAEDYYALYGILASTRFAFPGCEAKQQPRDLVPLMSAERWTSTLEPHTRQLAEVDAQLAELQLGPVFEEANKFETLAQGEVVEGGEVVFDPTTHSTLQTVRVEPGQLLRLTVDPNGNYGADTTRVEWKITSTASDSPQSWDLTADALRSFQTLNPFQDGYGNASVWWLLDGRGASSMLGESVGALSGQSALKAWRTRDNPAVFVNMSTEPVSVWTTLSAQSLFVHPAADGAVAIGWMSPFAGEVSLSVRVVDAHPGGPNGVLCRLERSAVDYRAKAKQLSERTAQRPALQERRSALVASAPTQPHAYAVAEQTPVNARLHQRGDPEQLGPEVPRRWLELLGGERLPPDVGSGRLELAHWLTEPDNPLTARVMVNRIWLQHFGRGLVATPNDFGIRGELPSHPELLDWLATEFMRGGWSVKRLHRLIMNSATYRQSNALHAAVSQQRAMEIDPNNRLLWRFERRRLSAEELRDTLLVASNQLDLTPGVEHPIAPSATWSFTQHLPFTGVPETNQRSIYLITLRNRRQPFFALFDGADPNASTPQRQVTTVPTQALYFMNDPFVHAQAERLIERVQSIAVDDRLGVIFHLVFQRLPTAAEQLAAERFMAKYRQSIDSESTAGGADPDPELATWQAYARVLLSSNEFLYVD